MVFTLLSHQWKSFWRRRGAGKNLALQLLFGFMMLYVLGCCLVLGIALKKLLREMSPDQDIVAVFSGVILYYFAIDIVLRLLIQDLPVLAVEPYLSQNIRRRQLVAFLNLRSLFHIFNLLPLMLFLPFIVTVLPPSYGWPSTIAFAVGILSLTIFNHFFVLYAKRKIMLNGWWLAGLIGLILLFGILDHLDILPVGRISAGLFRRLILAPWLTVCFIMLALLAFVNNRQMLLHNLYLEEIAAGEKKRRSFDYAWLRHWGTIGDLLALDIRLIFRCRRPRTVVLISFVFLLYGYLFFKPINLNPMHYGLLLFCSFFMTGLFIVNYGRYAFAWQSSHFDGLLAANVSPEDYIRCKITLFTLVGTVTFILSTAYGFIDRRLVPIEIAAWLYNIGVTGPLTIWFATFSYKAIDIDRSAFFNYQGTGGSDMLYSMGIFLVPFILYWPIALLLNPWTAIVTIGATGVICLLFRNHIITLLTKEFYKRKYLMLQGFREK